MAEPLTKYFGVEVPRRIAGMIAAVYSRFPTARFLQSALNEYETLNLMQRGRRIAGALREHLPGDYARAIEVLMASLGQEAPKQEGNRGMAPFLYLPHVLFVAEYGLHHFEASMRAQHELTRRFTAEFSIRSFLERYPDATLARLRSWAADPNADVRRLVSEGTRPRLPWASRLRAFQADPSPVLSLLELLKDDPDPSVRRSVANNLNDIGKDHPALLVETAKAWMRDATEERRRLIRHALRSALKRGEPGALGLLGVSRSPHISIGKASITPRRPAMGQSVTLACEMRNTNAGRQRVLVDFRIHFIKANGRTSPKVFKLKTVEFAPQGAIRLRKTVSLAQLTTRKHYPGKHLVDLLVNGRAIPLGAFELVR